MASFPMGDALDALECVNVPGARVIVVNIDISEHQASAVVEASSPAALEAFLDALTVDGCVGRWGLQLINLNRPSGRC